MIAYAHYASHGSNGYYWLALWMWHRVHWWTLGIMPVIVIGMAALQSLFGRGRG